MPVSTRNPSIDDPIDPGVGMMAMQRPSGSGHGKVDELEPALVERHTARAMELAEELAPKLRLMIKRRIPPRLKSRIEIEDVLHGAFIRLRTSLSHRSPGSDEVLRAWVIRSVLNEWHDQRRRHEAQCRGVDCEGPLPDGSVVMLLAGMGVSTSCGLRETIERIHETVKPEVFEIIWLRAADGLTYKEIGDIAGKSEDTIGKCYVRASRRSRRWSPPRSRPRCSRVGDVPPRIPLSRSRTSRQCEGRPLSLYVDPSLNFDDLSEGDDDPDLPLLREFLGRWEGRKPRRNARRSSWSIARNTLAWRSDSAASSRPRASFATRRIRTPSGSDHTGSSASWRSAGWARSTRPRTRSSTARWRSRRSASAGPPTRNSSNVSSTSGRPWPACTTPISCRSTARGRTTGSSTSRCR